MQSADLPEFPLTSVEVWAIQHPAGVRKHLAELVPKCLKLSFASIYLNIRESGDDAVKS